MFGSYLVESRPKPRATVTGIDQSLPHILTMRAHEGFWVYLATHGTTGAKRFAEKRKTEGVDNDPRWLVSRAGREAREVWLALSDEERAAYLRATPDENFPSDDGTGLLDDRKTRRTSRVSYINFVNTLQAERREAQSPHAITIFSPSEAAWIREQMEPFRSLPLDKPQWRRLLQAFVKRFPDRGRQPTMREYKIHVVRVEEERTAKELRLVDKKYPAKPMTRNITAEFKVQRKRLNAKEVIKKEKRERQRTSVSVLTEEDSEEAEELQFSDESDEDEQEVLEDVEDDPEDDKGGKRPPQSHPARGAMIGTFIPEPPHPSVEIMRKLRADLIQSEGDVALWKTRYDTANVKVGELKEQLKETQDALRDAKRQLQQRPAPTAVAATTATTATTAMTAASAAAPRSTTTSTTAAPREVTTSHTTTGLTFVINVHLDRGQVTALVGN